MLGGGGGGIGIVQAQEIESAVYKNLFGPPVARLRRQSSVGGILDGNSPLGEYTDPEPVSDIYPVRHLFLKDSEGRKKENK